MVVVVVVASLFVKMKIEMKSQAHENHQGIEIPFVKKKIGKKAKVKVEVKVSS